MRSHAIDWENSNGHFHYGESFQTLADLDESLLFGSHSNLLALEIISQDSHHSFQALITPKLEQCLKNEPCFGKKATALSLITDMKPHYLNKYQEELNRLFSLLSYRYNEYTWPSCESKLFTSLNGLYLAQHCNIDNEFEEPRRYLTNQLMDHSQQVFAKGECRAAFLYGFAKLIETFPFLGFQWGLELRKAFQDYHTKDMKPVDLCLIIQGKKILNMDFSRETSMLNEYLENLDLLLMSQYMRDENHVLFLAVSSGLLNNISPTF